MKINWHRLTRRTHYWASLLVLITAPIVIVTGVLLQLKKEVAWIQPKSQTGSGTVPSISFETILKAAAAVPQAGITDWEDIDRLDVRPDKGIVKVRSRNRWEVQVDTSSGRVLQTEFRRSDWIESIHDGSFFHPKAKLWLFLPSGVVLFCLWLSGVYLFGRPFLVKLRARRP
jgi:uncharacterized iron-regulated membrane protein